MLLVFYEVIAFVLFSVLGYIVYRQFGLALPMIFNKISKRVAVPWPSPPPTQTMAVPHLATPPPVQTNIVFNQF